MRSHFSTTKRIALLAFVTIVIVAIATLALTASRRSDPVSKKPLPNYVALGDSVAAGLGLSTYRDASACDRTNQSYPVLIARAQHYQLTDLACSGATIQNGILGSQDVNQLQEKPQLQALFSQPKPQLVTMTIGANDIGWSKVLTRCYTSVCGTTSDQQALTYNIQLLQQHLANVFHAVQQHYGAHPPSVIVTSYYQVFPQNGTCSAIAPITQAETAWVNAATTTLNQTIASVAAQYPFVSYAHITFSGHSLCATQPWIQDIYASAPYHPTNTGQQAYATTIEHLIK